jgi:hypothetical protein
MSTTRNTLLSLVTLGMAVWFSASAIAGRQGAAKTGESHQMPMTSDGMMMTKDQKIRNAMTAAPTAVSAKATILDWPTKEGEAPVVLRAGSNGWNCLPDMQDTKGNDPMCIDKPWMQWVEAYLAHKTPQLTSVGIGYMLAPGGGWGSNSDPYAMTMTPDNHWGLHSPHMMIAVPNLASLEGFPTEPANGGPYVMYKGTPYAHIMVPVK